jgi:hypothetical protein
MMHSEVTNLQLSGKILKNFLNRDTLYKTLKKIWKNFMNIIITLFWVVRWVYGGGNRREVWG